MQSTHLVDPGLALECNLPEPACVQQCSFLLCRQRQHLQTYVWEPCGQPAPHAAAGGAVLPLLLLLLLWILLLPMLATLIP